MQKIFIFLIGYQFLFQHVVNSILPTHNPIKKNTIKSIKHPIPVMNYEL